MNWVHVTPQNGNANPTWFMSIVLSPRSLTTRPRVVSLARGQGELSYLC